MNLHKPNIKNFSNVRKSPSPLSIVLLSGEELQKGTLMQMLNNPVSLDETMNGR